MTAKVVVQHLLEEVPGSADPKDFIDQYYAETQPEKYLPHVQARFVSAFQTLEKHGILRLLLNKYDADVIAEAIMQVALDQSPLAQTRRAYADIKRWGHSIL